MTVVCTVFTRRSVPPRGIVRRVVALKGEVSEFVWVNNGAGRPVTDELARMAATFAPSARVVLLTVNWVLPIARAWNVALERASSDFPDDDYLEVQDDVRVTPELLPALQRSRFDLPAAWHDNRPRKRYERFGLAYVVGMAVLIRNRVFRRLGYHDELFIKGVDEEYGMRGSLNGFTVGHISRPTVHHLGGVTALGDNRLAARLHEHGHALAAFLLEHGLLLGRREIRIRSGRGKIRTRIVRPGGMGEMK